MARPIRSDLEQQADIGLIAACQQGDTRAFHEVYEIYRDRVFALCRHMAGNREDAEDLTQESFVQAFRHVGSFRAEAAFGTWLSSPNWVAPPYPCRRLKIYRLVMYCAWEFEPRIQQLCL